jgi:hypothetical protein
MIDLTRHKKVGSFFLFSLFRRRFRGNLSIAIFDLTFLDTPSSIPQVRPAT